MPSGEREGGNWSGSPHGILMRFDQRREANTMTVCLSVMLAIPWDVGGCVGWVI